MNRIIITNEIVDLPRQTKKIQDRRSKGFVRKPIMADLIEFVDVVAGKRQLNITVNQQVMMPSPCPYHPAFIRLPKNGERCPVSSLSRSTLQSLIRGDEPKVESIVINEKGRSRGCRAIVTKSLIDYLDSKRKGGAV